MQYQSYKWQGYTQAADDMPEMHKTEATTIEPKARVLLVLSQDVLDRARVFAGKATTALKLPVSLQIVLRVLIEDGLKRDHHPALMASVEAQTRAVRQNRGQARRARAGGARRTSRSGALGEPHVRAPRRRPG